MIVNGFYVSCRLINTLQMFALQCLPAVWRNASMLSIWCHRLNPKRGDCSQGQSWRFYCWSTGPVNCHLVTQIPWQNSCHSIYKLPVSSIKISAAGVNIWFRLSSRGQLCEGWGLSVVDVATAWVTWWHCICRVGSWSFFPCYMLSVNEPWLLQYSKMRPASQWLIADHEMLASQYLTLRAASWMVLL